ncbi:AP2 domain-containing protein [Clostridium weizhouense]|uniref:AP2/ERF domain-containing protein n=1 Tax=Clostridium weizhouense TaxID=2859781 RepID=A0ABS7AJF0_9CLOT|nr:AP2 domain-containing protein [Clostridium weizhouense]MBW6408785.1 hypothetical protein [Clostridium weizhouense]
MLDLKGMQFGKLTVIAKTDKRYKRGIVWLCECKCGNKEYYVPSDFLLNHGVTHCNLCKWKDNGGNTKVFIKNTNIGIIKSNKIFSHNTSGVRGVYLHKKTNKWIAYINFKRKRYNLGSHKNKEDAVKARKEAEKKFYGNFLKWYNIEFKNKND